MFIVHGAWFRRNLRWWLGGVLIVLIPSFVALYTRTDTSGRGRSPKLPKIGGETVNELEYERTREVVDSELRLNRADTKATPEEELNQSTVVRLLLLRQASALNIAVTDDDVLDHIQHLPFLRNAQGQPDRERSANFLAYLANRHITESDFDEIVRQQLVIQRLQNLVTTAAKVTPLEVQQTFATLHERTTIAYVVCDVANYKEPIKLTDAEVAAYYEAHKESYRTPRQIKVQYVHVPLDLAAQKVSEEDIRVFFERSAGRFGTNSLASETVTIREELTRSRALSQAGDRATELTVKLVPEPGQPAVPFAKAAADLKLTVSETGFFGPEAKLPGINAGPQLMQVAFLLRPDAPISDVLEGEDGYYVLALTGEHESAIPPLADVRSKVEAELKQERALAATVKRGEDLATKVKALVAQGQSFADAAKQFGFAVQTSEPFNLTEKTTSLPAGAPVRERALGLRVGEVSEFLRTETGGVFFCVKDRSEPTAEEFAKQREALTRGLLRQSQDAIWQAWVHDLLRREQVSL